MKVSIKHFLALAFIGALLINGCAGEDLLQKSSVKANISALKDKDPAVRERGAYKLAAMGNEAAKATSELVDVIRDDENDNVRLAAIRAIKEIHRGSFFDMSGIVATLADVIRKNKNPEMQEAVTKAITRISSHSDPAVDLLVDLLGDKDPDVRLAVIDALGSYHFDRDDLRPEFLKKLDDEDPRVRASAAFALGAGYMSRDDLNPPQDATPALIEALNDEDAEVRLRAAISLAWLDPSVEEAIPVLIDSLDDPDRWRAIRALGQYGSKATDAVPFLIDILKGPPTYPGIYPLLSSLEVGSDLMAYLRENDPDYPLLADLEEIKVDRAEIIPGGNNERNYLILHWKSGRQESFSSFKFGSQELLDSLSTLSIPRTLAQIGPEPGVVEVLIEMISKEDDIARGAAIRALGDIGDEAKDAVPLLLELLKSDSDPHIRFEAAWALGKIGPDAHPDILPAVLRALDDREGDARIGAVSGIKEMGPKAKEAFPILKGIVDAGEAVAVGDGDWRFYHRVTEAMISIGPESGELMPFLDELLSHKNIPVAYTVAERLGDYGVEALPLLAKAIKHSDHNVRSQAIRALEKVVQETEEAIPYLASALSDEYLFIRRDAAFALFRLGTKARDAVPELIEGLKLAHPMTGEQTDLGSDGQIVRSRDFFKGCLKAIEKIGPDAADAVPIISTFLSAVRPEFRIQAIYALAGIGPASVETVPTLIEQLLMENANIREAAAYALGQIGPAAKEAVPSLIKLLSDEDPSVRWNAATSLGLIGHDAVGALIDLHGLADTDPNLDVRNAAKGAIGKIESS